jgi:hypothetical protein
LCKTNFHREEGFYKIFPYDAVEKTQLESFFYSSFFPYITDGDVILFPPYLTHSVTPNFKEKNKMRLTFSFNLIKK